MGSARVGKQIVHYPNRLKKIIAHLDHFLGLYPNLEIALLVIKCRGGRWAFCP